MKTIAKIAVIGVAAALAGCGNKGGSSGTHAAPGNATPGPGTPGAKVTLRLGYQPNVSHAVPLVGFAPDKSLYAKAMPEVDFQTRTFNAGPAMMEALKAGALDVALFGPPPILNTWTKSHDFVVLTNTAIGGSVLVARPGSSIKSAKDLSGKRIAVPQTGNVQDVFVKALLAQNGLATANKGGSVTLVAMDSPAILAAMQSGQLDAACVPEPWGSRLEQDAKATAVLEWNKLPLNGNYPQTMYVASRKWVDAQPDEAKKLVKVTNDLTAQIAKNPAGYVDVISSEIKRTSGKTLAPALVSASLKRVQFSSRVSDADLDKFAGLMVQAGILKSKPDTTGIVYAPR